MDSDITTCKSRDILSNPRSALLVFGLPIIAIVLTGSSPLSRWRPIVWTVALAVMGLACIANALRCGRVHCYITGPFFLLMAVASFLYGFGVLPLGPRGWNIISLIVFIGAIFLCCLPEMIWGRYRKTDAQ